MRKLISVFLTMVFGAAFGSAFVADAENLIYVLPQKVEAGSVSDDANYFIIAMNNEAEFTAIQFDLYLPQGVRLDEEYDPIELSTERFPYTVDRKGNKTFKHNVNYALHADGFYRVQITSQELEKISGNAGELLTVYYVSDADLPAGPLAVEIKNVTMAISGTEGVYPPVSASYFWSGDYAPAGAAVLDLSALEGYMSADVVADLLAQISANPDFCALHLDNLDSLGAEISLTQPNALVYLKSGSEAYAMVTGNRVACSDSGRYVDALTLVDGQPFATDVAFDCGSVEVSREISGIDWQPMVLPFTLSAETYDGKLAVVVPETIEEDSEGATLTWKGTSKDVEANTPFFFKQIAKAGVSFEAQNATLQPATAEQLSATLTAESGHRYTLVGTYAGENALPAEAYLIGKGEFLPAAAEQSVAPFRFYLIANDFQPTKIVNKVENDMSGVATVDAEPTATPDYYDLQGRKATPTRPGIYVTKGTKTAL